MPKRIRMEILAAVLLVSPFVILWHEAAHAAFALATTRSQVMLMVGFGPSVGFGMGRLQLRFAPLLMGGFCAYDGDIRRGDRALVAAAGPVASVFLAALAWNLRGEATLLGQVAVMSASMAVITALPLRYPPGMVNAGGADSDGLTVLTALFPASRLAIPAPAPERRPGRPLRAPFAFVLLACTGLAFAVSFWLGAFMLVMFGAVYLNERR